MRGTVVPFLKWAGGKRWLSQSGSLPPIAFNGRYFEPFLGSGAMFFSLRPKRAVLSDANAELIELYEIVRDEPAALRRKLEWHQKRHSAEHYYRVRGNVPAIKIERAARMLYLNRTCWNGLYRLNRKGEFNVPIGTKTNVLLDDDFGSIAKILDNTELSTCDFSETVQRAGAGDLVYADPPYTVKHNANGFLKYNEKIFSWEDQIRLRDEAVAASNRGATILISNADHSSLHEIYEGIASLTRLTRASVISGHASARGIVSEALFVISPVTEATPTPDLTELILPDLAKSGAAAPLR